MRRREFLGVFGSAAAWPLGARAQQPTMPLIGWLAQGSPQKSKPYVAAFHQGLGETGFFEGRNVAIEYSWAEQQDDRLPAMATDLVQRGVSVIATGGGVQAALAAKSATAAVPIVFQIGVDPVAFGLVASLNRPGGNITGVTSLNVELGRKRLEVFHELLPSATVLAAIVKPTNPNSVEYQSNEVQAEANALGVQLHVLRASHEDRKSV